MKPKISVVVTTYNRYKRLKKTIKSILDQTFKDYEIIIVDDYSDDKTENYCRKLVKKYNNIRYSRRINNFGQHTRPKNEGIMIAESDLIAFCDDDVCYRPDHLQVLYKEMEKMDVDVVYGDRMLQDETGKFSKVPVPGIRSNFNMELLGQKNFIDTSDVLCKKKALLSVGGFDESLKKFADWNLWVRLGKDRKKFKRVPIIITDYHVHKGCNQFKTEGMTFNPYACKIYPDNTSLGKRKKLKVAVFSLTYNRLNCTKKSFKSMEKNTNYFYDHFIIDQGSTDGTKEFLKGDFGRLIKYNKNNVGISKGSNQALDMIGNDYDIIIKMDNDAEVMTKNWLEQVIDVFERNKRVVVGLYPEGLKDHPGGVPRVSYGYIDKNFIGVVNHLGGIAIAAPKEAYQDFRWKDNDFLHGIQDYEFSQHCLKKGFNLLYLENVKVNHLESTENKKEKITKYEERKLKH